MDQALLDEHAPRNESSKGETYEPTDAEKKAIKLVEKLFSKAKKARSIYDEKWVDYYRFFRGKQWKEQRPTYRHSEVINFVFRTIQSLVPIQTDSRPKTDFLPAEPSDLELASLLSEANEADWTKNNWSMELLEVIYDANLYGTGISTTGIKYDKKSGYNKICFHSCDPFYFYPDPDAVDVNKKADFAIYAEPMDVAKIKKQYPDMKDFIKPDLVDMVKQTKNELGQIRFRSPVDEKVVMESASPADALNKDKALLITCYLSAEFLEDDFDEIEKPKIGDDGTQIGVEYVQQAKWPNGRKIVICNNVLLEDGPNPYDDGEIPFERLVNYSLPREFWGISEVEQLEGPQKIFNKIFSFALDCLTLTGNPIWVIDTNSGVDTENVTTRPGLVIEKTPGSEVRREEGTQLQPYVLQLADRLVEYVDSIAGSNDVSRGVQPTGVTAASAITSLQEAAYTRIRQKSRCLDAYLQNVGQHWKSRTFQFRTAPEIYRLTNNEGANKYFKMHVEHNDDGGKRIVVQKYNDNGLIDVEQTKVYETLGDMDVKVSTGSSLPFNKAEKEQKLLNFFDRGLIDAEEVLKGADYPNYQAVLNRMMAKAQAQAQANPQAGVA